MIENLILVHRIAGYFTAFVVAPVALLAFTKINLHRNWGKAYLYLMFFLYATGVYFTLTQHYWFSWEFARNLTFNFFGFSMLIYAYRAILLFSKKGEVSPDRIDRLLAKMLTYSVIALFSVAIWKNTPMRVFTLIGIWLCIIEWKELKAAVWEKAVLYKRHQRYILASYFYVLTVVSIVHLKDELPQNLRWLWATALAVFAIWLLTEAKRQGKVLINVSQATINYWVIRTIFLFSMLYGCYIMYDLFFGAVIKAQV